MIGTFAFWSVSGSSSSSGSVTPQPTIVASTLGFQIERSLPAATWVGAWVDARSSVRIDRSLRVLSRPRNSGLITTSDTGMFSPFPGLLLPT